MNWPTEASCLKLLLATLLIGATVAAQKQEPTTNEPQHPAPEPYSFSYTADSQGGQSTHQERGDGTGRVEGFYTIMGEDGRERRVDYVADENGYRASVKTNEVGTRSEPAADANYEAEIPSAKQLEAAKVTYEQYKYLEDAHLMQRQRHTGHKAQNWSTVSGGAVNTQYMQANNLQNQQQQQQQAWQNQQQTNQQTGNARENNNLSRQPINPNPSINYENSFSDNSNSNSDTINLADGTIDPDNSWRARSARLQAYRSQQQQQSQPQQQQQPQFQQQQTQPQPQPQPQPQLQESSTVAYNYTNVEQQQQVPSGQDFQQQQVTKVSGNSGYQQQQQLLPQPPPPLPQANAVINQKTNKQNWQMFNSNGNKRPATILQRQLEAQFMQQASQLTDQDYPRQSTQSSQSANSNQFNLNQQQQQQQVPNNNEYYNQYQKTNNQINRIRQEFESGARDFSQQQTNILNEVPEDRDQQPEVQVNENQRQINQEQVTQQPQQLFISQSNSTKIDQQPMPQVSPFTTTTTSTTSAPFISLDLNEGSEKTNQINYNNSSNDISDQNQEVENSRQTSDGLTVNNLPTISAQQQQQGNRYDQQSVKTTEEPQQQVAGDITSTQAPQRPTSVNQIIEFQKQDSQQQTKFPSNQFTKTAQVQGMIMRAIPVVSTTTNFRPYEPTTVATPTYQEIANQTTSYLQPAITTTSSPFLSSTTSKTQQTFSTTELPRQVVPNTTKLAPYMQPTTTQLPITRRPQYSMTSSTSSVKGGQKTIMRQRGRVDGQLIEQSISQNLNQNQNEFKQQAAPVYRNQQQQVATGGLRGTLTNTSGNSNNNYQVNRMSSGNYLSGVKGGQAKSSSGNRRQFWQQQQLRQQPPVGASFGPTSPSGSLRQQRGNNSQESTSSTGASVSSSVSSTSTSSSPPPLSLSSPGGSTSGTSSSTQSSSSTSTARPTGVDYAASAASSQSASLVSLPFGSRVRTSRSSH